MRNLFRWLLGLPLIDKSQPIQHLPTRKPNPSPMDEGDYHSGPYGYSPNTAYPETQYGSGFDEDAEWNEEH
ncbi:MAG: hypothetical protein K9G13_03710 [Aquiluna sp.]|nr:hypothetical protein [Aquiluna sp.]MCF8545626.1 hypothetical protein [Aquiluna sp.]